MNFICKKEDFTYVRNGFKNTVLYVTITIIGPSLRWLNQAVL